MQRSWRARREAPTLLKAAPSEPSPLYAGLSGENSRVGAMPCHAGGAPGAVRLSRHEHPGRTCTPAISASFSCWEDSIASRSPRASRATAPTPTTSAFPPETACWRRSSPAQPGRQPADPGGGPERSRGGPSPTRHRAAAPLDPPGCQPAPAAGGVHRDLRRPGRPPGPTPTCACACGPAAPCRPSRSGRATASRCWPTTRSPWPARVIRAWAWARAGSSCAATVPRVPILALRRPAAAGLVRASNLDRGHRPARTKTNRDTDHDHAQQENGPCLLASPDSPAARG